MAEFRDALMTACSIILREQDVSKIDEVLRDLESEGFSITPDSVSKENGVIGDAVAESSVVERIAKSGRFSYVRPYMTFIADYPAGDPRDKDGINRES